MFSDYQLWLSIKRQHGRRQYRQANEKNQLLLLLLINNRAGQSVSLQSVKAAAQLLAGLLAGRLLWATKKPEQYKRA